MLLLLSLLPEVSAAPVVGNQGPAGEGESSTGSGGGGEATADAVGMVGLGTLGLRGRREHGGGERVAGWEGGGHSTCSCRSVPCWPALASAPLHRPLAPLHAVHADGLPLLLCAKRTSLHSMQQLAWAARAAAWMRVCSGSL